MWAGLTPGFMVYGSLFVASIYTMHDILVNSKAEATIIAGAYPSMTEYSLLTKELKRKKSGIKK